MADNYDRDENDSNGGGFMMGLLTGTVLGAGLGMLLAPKAGSELRGAIGEQARNLGEQARNIGTMASEQARNVSGMAADQARRAGENASGWADKGREFVDRARDAVARGAEEARGYANGATGGTTGGTNYGSSSSSGSAYPGPTGNSPTGGDFNRS